MFRRRISLLVVAWAGLAMLAPATAADTVFPRGSRIGLEPPAGFTPSKKFVGFEDEGRSAAISVLDLPGPAYQAFETSAFANSSKTLTVEKRELFAFRDGVGFLITAREVVNGTDYRSWYLLANVTTREVGHIAAMIALREPKSATAVYSDRIVRAALATVTFRQPPLEEALGMLPYKLTVLGGFRVSKVLPQGGTVVLTEGANDDSANQAYIVVSIGRGAPDATELRPKFAQDLLTAAPLRDLTITSGEPMRINNQQGFELRAKATGASGKPITLVQWLRFGSNNVFTRVIGVVDADRWNEVFPRFRQVRDGVARR